MSAHGPRALERSFYGRSVSLRIRLADPRRLRNVAFWLLVLAATFVGFGLAVMNGPRASTVVLCGLALGGIALWLFGAASKAAGAAPDFLKLGLQTLHLPPGSVLLRSDEVDVRLADVAHVEVIWNGDIALKLDDGNQLVIPAASLPPDWSVADLATLLLLRVRGARAKGARAKGAGAKVSAAQQTALEAHVFEGGEALGVVLDTRGKHPKPIAIAFDLEDYEALLGRPGFPHADHVLIVPADRVEETRSALTADIVASFAGES